MKRRIMFYLAMVIVLSMVLTACGKPSEPGKEVDGGDEPKAWLPSQNVDFIVTSSAGGGSDIFGRTITDILTSEGICSETFLVNNVTDGNGEVGRLQVSQAKGKNADHTLLSMNSGDFMDMIDNTDNRIESFRPVGVMAVDKQLIFVGENPKYENFESVLKALSEGKEVIMGGSKGSDIATFEALLDEIGYDDNQLKYIVYDSTSEAITSILGNHVDLLISKPAASLQFVEAKSLKPILALSDARFEGILSDAPTLSEVGDYKDVEVPIWRSVVAPKEMSDEAIEYWSEALRKVAESDTWLNDYIAKNSLIADYRDYKDTKAYIENFQKNYLGN